MSGCCPLVAGKSPDKQRVREFRRAARPRRCTARLETQAPKVEHQSRALERGPTPAPHRLRERGLGGLRGSHRPGRCVQVASPRARLSASDEIGRNVRGQGVLTDSDPCGSVPQSSPRCWSRRAMVQQASSMARTPARGRVGRPARAAPAASPIRAATPAAAARVGAPESPVPVEAAAWRARRVVAVCLARLAAGVLRALLGVPVRPVQEAVPAPLVQAAVPVREAPLRAA